MKEDAARRLQEQEVEQEVLSKKRREEEDMEKITSTAHISDETIKDMVSSYSLSDGKQWDTDSISTNLGPRIWENIDFGQLLKIAANCEATDWFSRHVTKKPHFMMIEFKGEMNKDNMHLPLNESFVCEISMGFPYKGQLHWTFKEFPLTDEFFSLKIGDYSLNTRFKNPYTSFRGESIKPINSIFEDGRDPLSIVFDVIAWLRKLFNCPINCIEFFGTSATLQDKCSQMIPGFAEIKYITFDACRSVGFVQDMLPQREKHRFPSLNTGIYELDLHEPVILPPDLLFAVSVSRKKYYLNLTTTSYQQVVGLYGHAIIRKSRYLYTKLSNWSEKDLKSFKQKLKLSSYSDKLNDTHWAYMMPGKVSLEKYVQICGLKQHKKYVKMLDDGSALVISVVEKEDGTFDGLELQWWIEWKELQERGFNGRECNSPVRFRPDSITPDTTLARILGLF